MACLRCLEFFNATIKTAIIIIASATKIMNSTAPMVGTLTRVSKNYIYDSYYKDD